MNLLGLMRFTGERLADLFEGTRHCSRVVKCTVASPLSLLLYVFASIPSLLLLIAASALGWHQRGSISVFLVSLVLPGAFRLSASSPLFSRFLTVSRSVSRSISRSVFLSCPPFFPPALLVSIAASLSSLSLFFFLAYPLSPCLPLSPFVFPLSLSAFLSLCLPFSSSPPFFYFASPSLPLNLRPSLAPEPDRQSPVLATAAESIPVRTGSPAVRCH